MTNCNFTIGYDPDHKKIKANELTKKIENKTESINKRFFKDRKPDTYLKTSTIKSNKAKIGPPNFERKRVTQTNYGGVSK